MIVIICAKHKKNPSRTVDTTERTWFSKSRPNDLEEIGQGQRSSHATHPLMLLIICTKYGKNPSWTVDATGRTWKVNGQTDGQTDRVNPIYPPNFVAGGYNKYSYHTIFILFFDDDPKFITYHLILFWNECARSLISENISLWIRYVVVINPSSYRTQIRSIQTSNILLCKHAYFGLNFCINVVLNTLWVVAER